MANKVSFKNSWSTTEVENIITGKASSNVSTKRTFVAGAIYFTTDGDIYVASSTTVATKYGIGSTLTSEEIQSLVEAVEATSAYQQGIATTNYNNANAANATNAANNTANFSTLATNTTTAFNISKAITTVASGVTTVNTAIASLNTKVTQYGNTATKIQAAITTVAAAVTTQAGAITSIHTLATGANKTASDANTKSTNALKNASAAWEKADSISIDSLGLGNALHYVGLVTSLPTSGNKKGDVVIFSNSSKEYVFDGSAWKEIGDENSWTTRAEYNQVLSDITSLGESIDNLNDDITTLSGAVNTNKNNIATLSGSIKTLTNNQATANKLLEANNTNFGAVGTTLTFVSGKVSTNNTNILSLSGTVKTNTDTISGNTTKITDAGTTNTFIQQVNSTCTKQGANNATAIKTNQNNITNAGTTNTYNGDTAKNAAATANSAYTLANSVSGSLNTTITNYLTWN